ncbi:FecR family protein [Ekhidna sp.]
MEEVLAKYFSGEASKDEISSVESWRCESKNNANTFLDVKNAWLATQPKETPPEHVLGKILDEKPKGKQASFMMSTWIRYASAAVLILAISLLFILNQDSGQSIYTSQKLDDGSVVALHGDSGIEILKFNDSIREIRIIGKAYFDIERDEKRPFVIHTENAKVQVLGTSFVVDAYKGNTEVCVETGLVELVKSDGVAVKLEMGEMGLVSTNNKGIIKRNNNDLNYLAWKTKVITFNESSMSEVKEVIEDVYGIEMNFENPLFQNCKLTAKFNKKKAKDAIEIIARTFGIEYDYSNGKAVLKGKGC